MTGLLQATRIMFFLVLILLPCSSNAQEEFSSNWWTNDMVTAKGHGFPPINAGSLEQARNLSRRAAIADGYRALAEQVHGVHITAETTIKSQIISGDIVESKVSAVIRGAEILSEEFADDGSCVVVLGVPVYGENSIANLAFKRVEKENFPLPTSDKVAQGNYTGLIIDCGDLDLKPVLAPVIRNEKNQSVYSYSNLAFDKVVSSGMVGYITDGKDKKILPVFVPVKRTLVSYNEQIANKLLFVTSAGAKTAASRAGSNPLIIKAKALSDDNSCPIISDEDSDRILAENQATHFLDNTAVVFTNYRVGGLRA